MEQKLPLVDQEGKAPTRKLVAGVSAGVTVAVTLVPALFPAVMQVIEVLDPVFAATWGPTIAAVVSAILSVLGGGTVSYAVRNRATPADVIRAAELAAKLADKK